MGEACYHFSAEPADWKAASLACRALRAHLLELESAAERLAVGAALRADERLRGAAAWTGGLNPGLLWIWAHSARPVADNHSAVPGAGRCLALAPAATADDYALEGRECALRHRFVCEREPDRANEIKAGRLS